MKIGVVGAGQVGATTAQRLAERELGDVVLADILEGVPQGKALDLAESAPVQRYDVRLSGTNDYRPFEGASVVILTAGLPRKPGMSRDDLLKKNAEIVTGVVEKIHPLAPDAFWIVVSNPLDVMTFLVRHRTRLPRSRVVGMAGVLDSARFRSFLAQAAGVSVRDVQAMVLGGHGDDMVPLVRYATIAGIPVSEWLAADKIEQMVARTRGGGAEIVSLLKTGSAFYAPSAAAVEMAEAVVRDQKRVLPCCAFLEGEYGLRDVCVGVPVVLGAKGMERVVDLNLSDAERKALHASASHVREGISALALA
ncbi:MAG: malate dehydrogenase [Planctomycetes bacterium]|nr:malate dehydrogenase [Planctomycetota bacterium]